MGLDGAWASSDQILTVVCPVCVLSLSSLLSDPIPALAPQKTPSLLPNARSQCRLSKCSQKVTSAGQARQSGQPPFLFVTGISGIRQQGGLRNRSHTQPRGKICSPGETGTRFTVCNSFLTGHSAKTGRQSPKGRR